MAHCELDSSERQVVEEMLLTNSPVAKIAEKLARHRSTIYRGIKRNTFADEEMPELDGYYGKIAGDIAAERREQQAKVVRNSSICAAVIDGLEHGWLTFLSSKR